MPEAGVSFFSTFVIALVVGFLLVVAGMPTLGAVLFAVSIISILAMVLTPSPKALAERRAAGRPEEDEAMSTEDEVPGDVEEEKDRPTMIAPPAPTSARPSIPTPPPEPPPLEEIEVDVEVEVEVDVEPEGTDEEDEAEQDDILVEL